MDSLRLALRPSVVRRATVIALLVGTVLVMINHGDALLRGDLTWSRSLRIILTVMVPYCVSTYSSVCALRERFAGNKDAAGALERAPR